MLGWAFVLALVCSPALASQLFHSPSDDGIPGAPEVPTGGVQSVFLYLDGGAVGTAAGETCNDGDGDEICGFDLELTALSGLSFSAFTPDAGADLLVNFAAASVLINGLDAVTPAAGPVRIGELQVNAIEGGQVELTSGEVIGADLGSEVLSAQTIVTVPEPGHLLLLVSGIGLLVGLARKGAN
jgi:hypothetical protein